MNGLTLTNTDGFKKQAFSPISPEAVSLYTCGPTVYDHPHIGNWRAFIFYDTLSRVLRLNGYELKHVLNITDVGHLTSDADEGEDKLEAAAQKASKTAWEVASEFTAEFMAGVKSLNINPPAFMPRATDHIPEQIDLIKQLETKGYAYVIDDGVYFDVSKFEGYGRMARLDLDALKAGARVAVNPQKRHPADFALWKFSPANSKRDMEWDSPWGKGFPGWHLECSAIAMKFLGPTIDIHGGGVDHIPVHHTNEIAQSEAATGKPFARWWLHNEFMMVEGEKMSKSKNNFFTLATLEERDFEPLAFRLLMLQSHYRSQINFTWEALSAAAVFLQTLRRIGDISLQPLAKGIKFSAAAADEVIANMTAGLNDDLNTPIALGELAKLSDQLFAVDGSSTQNLQAVLKFADQALGLDLSNRKDIGEGDKKLIAEREAARGRGDFATADRIRERLHDGGIGLDDTPAGAVWFRLKG